jgi:hypothetical protein
MLRLITGFSPKKSGFNSRTGHVRFVVDEIAIRQGLLRIQLFARSVSAHKFPELIQSNTGAVKS